MFAKSLAIINDTNEYPENTSDIVNALKQLQHNNDTSTAVDDQLRSWIDDRLTMLVNLEHIEHVNPDLAKSLPSETRRQIDIILQKSGNIIQFRPKRIYT